ncbi:MAG TPA: HAD family hydrolase [Polyangiaceae bacterium]
MANAAHQAWLVDLDGTLYASRWVKLAMAGELALFGWPAFRTLRQFRQDHEALRADQSAGRALTHESPFASQLARTAATLDQPVERVAALVDDWMFARPGKWIRRFARHDLLAELRDFKASGGLTALVSDYPAERKLAALGCRELFDAVVANGEQHGPARLKPDPEGYLRAAQLLDVAPASCLVIGDRDDADGAAARAAGMSFRLV